MSFTKWLNSGTGITARYYFEKQLMKWSLIDGDIRMEIPKKPHEVPHGHDLKAVLDRGGFPKSIYIHCLQGALAYGPKILRLTGVDFAILEQTDLTLAIEDYNQPYETVIVEWPETYAASKAVPDPRSGMFDEMTKTLHKGVHKPIHCIIRHDPVEKIIFVCLCLDSNDCYNTVIYGDGTIEEIRAQDDAKGSYDKSLPILNEEREVYRKVIRAALNACLYADEFGVKNKGPDNPKQHARLKHFAEVARKSGDQSRIQKTSTDLKSHPEVFEINQDVRLTVSSARSERNGSSSRVVEPHWRRGHYRMQRYGPGLSEKKRIRIKAIFINADLFGGDQQNTRVNLHD